MTDPRADLLPDPSPALRRRFEAIARGPMQGLPMVNPKLGVQALAFQPWGPHWLGVVITPWFMNLVLMPREVAQWPVVTERESRWYSFPAGVFEFIGAQDDELGRFQACSLFSPMFEFDSDEIAAATARAALQALFDTANLPQDLGTPLPALQPSAAEAASPAMPAAPSKRDFLFGSRASRSPAQP